MWPSRETHKVSTILHTDAKGGSDAYRYKVWLGGWVCVCVCVWVSEKVYVSMPMFLKRHIVIKKLLMKHKHHGPGSREQRSQETNKEVSNKVCSI